MHVSSLELTNLISEGLPGIVTCDFSSSYLGGFLEFKN